MTWDAALRRFLASDDSHRNGNSYRDLTKVRMSCLYTGAGGTSCSQPHRDYRQRMWPTMAVSWRSWQQAVWETVFLNSFPTSNTFPLVPPSANTNCSCTSAICSWTNTLQSPGWNLHVHISHPLPSPTTWASPRSLCTDTAMSQWFPPFWCYHAGETLAAASYSPLWDPEEAASTPEASSPSLKRERIQLLPQRSNREQTFGSFFKPFWPVAQATPLISLPTPFRMWPGHSPGGFRALKEDKFFFLPSVFKGHLKFSLFPGLFLPPLTNPLWPNVSQMFASLLTRPGPWPLSISVPLRSFLRRQSSHQDSC